MASPHLVNFQSVWKRVVWAISTFQSIDLSGDLSSSDLRNLLKSYCEGTRSRMEYIQEDSEEEDEKQHPERTVDPLISGSLPFN